MLENLCKNCFEEITVMPCLHCNYKGELPKKGEILPQGTILNGRYMLGKVLGHGGFGITYLGYDLNFEFKVAIKEYYPDGLCTRTRDSYTVHSYSGEATDNYQYGKSKFIDEGKTMAKLSEVASIVNVKDYFMENNSAYLVMEYLDGITLKEHLKSQPDNKIKWEETKEIMIPVIQTLSEVHKIGIIHRDISPDNIFITKRGKVKLLDFGAARYAISEKSKSLSVILKQGYAPPEQYSSKGKQGVWTDIYSLCATIYRCLTGKPPEESIERMGGESLEPISNYAQIPVHNERAINKGLNISYKDRFSDIQELARCIGDTSIGESEPLEIRQVKISNNKISAQEQLYHAKLEIDRKREEDSRLRREKQEIERIAREEFRERRWRQSYEKALEVLAGGQYKIAYDMFIQFGDFDNSKELAMQAKKLFDEERYQRAIKGNDRYFYNLFVELGDYKDSKKRAEAIKKEICKENYRQAIELFGSKKYGPAKDKFIELDDYRETKKYLLHIKKKEAKKLVISIISTIGTVLAIIIMILLAT